MSKPTTYQAVTRIGPVKATDGRAGMQARRVGETFTLDVSDPVERAIRDRLFRHGAILPIDEPDLPIVQGIPDNEGQVNAPAPVITEISEPPESSETVIAPEPLQPAEPLPLDASIDTLIDILTPEIASTLKRSGVKTIRDLEKREDNALRGINGIGAVRLAKLREAYNDLKAEEMKHGAVSND